ncbi:TonB-dependent receptor plug domain-containing protein [Emcibacter sp.]|uniref:TonB-dependent receptor plug domain-containing protein n=1 Tax=Emcibacter sp. TaxID=1979954 RepID=UPI002AA954C2|nr:TonB-dependent receptor [Emcibacter sp.]
MHTILNNPLKSLLLASTSMMLAATTAQAQEAAADEALEFEEVVVVGTRIKGLSEAALPVTVMGNEQMEAVGATNMQDILSYIPAIGDFEFQDANTGTNGARGDVAGVNMRSLGSGNTLTLINGRRMVVHPTFQNINDVPTTFYNVNSIPSSAIQRVEVLRDGASALYGADATGGVVNMVPFTSYDGIMVSGKYGFAENTGYDELTLTARGGWSLNDDKTKIGVFGTYYKRSGVPITELDDLYGTLDRRENENIPEEWQGDSQLNNLSSTTPYSVFTTGSLNDQGTWESTGTYHVNPDGSTSSGSGSERYDFNEDVWITPEVDRFNAMINLKHEFDNGIELFADALYYNSKSTTQRAASPLDSGLAYIIIPEENYYLQQAAAANPDLAGSDVLLTRYRPVELGARIIEVNQDAFRVMTGLSGDAYGWDWETALVYSEATADDEEFNRQSKNLLSASLALTTPDAFNVFGGPDANSEAVLESIRISSVQKSKTTLATWDFKLTKDDLFSLPGGDVGTAVGVEWRRESYLDDRDPRQDGSMPYSYGELYDESDVVGVSATTDSSASRHVFSSFAEMVLPFVGEANAMPGIHALEFQLAARYENFSDAGDTLKPKVGFRYAPVESFSFRGSFAKGFRAPNLPQMNQGDIIRRSLGVEDPLRSDVTGLDIDTGALYRITTRLGNDQLEPEHTDTLTLGAVFEPTGALDGLRVTFDWWKIEQENVVVILDADYQLELEALTGSNPNVIRAAVTAEDQAAFDAWNLANPGDQRTAVGVATNIISQYINADKREVEGWDASIEYRTGETGAGSFRFRADLSRLSKFVQTAGDVETDYLRRNGNPEWRASGSISWMYDDFTTTVTVKHVGSVYDTSLYDSADSGNSGTVDEDLNRVYWDVDSWTTFDVAMKYRFTDNGNAIDGTVLGLGVRNVGDKQPPFADESNGYFTSLHNSYGRVWWLSVSKEF